MERREFIKSGVMAAGAMAVPNILRAQGSRGRVRMGFIGVGNRGTQLLHIFMKNPLVEVTALADIYEPYLRRDDSAFDPKFLEWGLIKLFSARYASSGFKLSRRAKPVSMTAPARSPETEQDRQRIS